MKSVVVVSEDRAGLLADVSYVLSKTGIPIDGIDVDVVGGKAIVSLSVKDNKKAKSELEKNGFRTVEPDALVIKISNHLKAMGDMMNMLERKKVRIQDLSEISSGTENKVLAITVNKRRKASRLLVNFMIGAAPG